ncbi:mitogen-activated protein kinase kinase kinase 2-like [Arachis hypogaea]|nr:mitogen-activated protein kinase kinase kinase 2-like [Arachis hypogaea]
MDLHRYKQLKTEQEILSKLNYPQIVAYKDCDVTLENGERNRHGDVKEQNDLVTTQRVKIADFDCTLRVVADGEVLEIITEIPCHVSEEGKDFMAKCFKRDLMRGGWLRNFLDMDLFMPLMSILIMSSS